MKKILTKIEISDSKLAGLCEVCHNPTEHLKLHETRYKCPLCRPKVEGELFITKYGGKNGRR